jgi:flagellin-like protein
LKDEKGVSPVIAVILMVAITVVLSAVLYTMVMMFIIDPDITPTGGLTFQASNTTPGKYYGSFISLSDSVKLTDVSVTIIDESLDQSKSFALTPDGGSVQIGNGLRLNYTDTLDNNKIDGGDMIVIENAEMGDVIKFVHEPSNGIIAEYDVK